MREMSLKHKNTKRTSLCVEMLPSRTYGTTTTRTHTSRAYPPWGPLAHPVHTGALGGAGGDVVMTVGVRLAVIGSVGIKGSKIKGL